MVASAVLGVFVTFSRIRSKGRLLLIACAAPVIILLSNFVRFLSWALLNVYGFRDATSGVPRNVSTVVCLVLAYLLFVVAAEAELRLFVAEEPEKCEGES